MRLECSTAVQLADVAVPALDMTIVEAFSLQVSLAANWGLVLQRPSRAHISRESLSPTLAGSGTAKTVSDSMVRAGFKRPCSKSSSLNPLAARS